MTRLFLITLLVLSSGSAYAEWVRIGYSESLGGYTAYVDPDTIRRSDETTWRPVAPGSVGHGVWKFACGCAIAPCRTPPLT